MQLPRPRAPMHLAAMASLLVLALGLPRLLVLCQHADGAASLELAHAAGACCDHDGDGAHAVAQPCDHDGGCVRPDDGCDHHQLAVELLPAPRSDAAAAGDPPPPCGWLTAGPPPLPTWRAVAPHPPATGPPRVDRRTALRATTLLLV